MPSRGQLAKPGEDQSELVEPSRNTLKNRILPKDRDTLLEAKDQTIAKLKEQVAFLRRELKRKEDIMLRMTEGGGELLPAPASETSDSRQPATPRRVRDGNQSRDAQKEQEKSERPTLPEGYRVVATASDAWVLVGPRGMRVAGYWGKLDLWRAALDAHKHHQHE